MRPSRIIDGKKYMWNGAEYAGEDAARAASERYRSEGFETQVILDGGKAWVYTRRVVTEIKLEGAPPT